MRAIKQAALVLGGASLVAVGFGSNGARAAGAAPRTLQFSGYAWQVKSSASPVGPGPNVFSPSGPYVDSSGNLHLRIRRTASGQWTSSEVFGESTMGYGTYQWTVKGPLSSLDPNVVLGLFTYDSTASAPPSAREIDFEVARWGSTAAKADNADYVVQPVTSSTADYFRLPRGATLTVGYDWTAGQVVFSGSEVTSTGGAVDLPTYTVSGAAVPTPGNEVVHMNLWLFQGQAPVNAKAVSVVIDRFTFTPAS